GTILTRSGDYFQVFSQFKKTCLEHLHRSLPALAHRVKRQAPLHIPADPVPQHVDGFETPARALREHWPAGEAQAQGRLSRFLDEAIDDYQQLRDLPAKPGTSQLSPYLAAGQDWHGQVVQGALQCLAIDAGPQVQKYGAGAERADGALKVRAGNG
ncbi:hypothetical protein, partial [Streptomyces rochei]|uniref:hypothetical protein n=1 Tax=Streptomyces rochei TaxID=1928 RepID=UPI003F686817|nr:hypothetical protein [Streptomyces rochei]